MIINIMTSTADIGSRWMTAFSNVQWFFCSAEWNTSDMLIWGAIEDFKISLTMFLALL